MANIEQRAHYLRVLDLFGGAAAEQAGLALLEKVDRGEPLGTFSAAQVAPEVAGFTMPDVPWTDIGRFLLKLIGCAVKNIGLAIQEKWAEFALAVWKCAVED